MRPRFWSTTLPTTLGILFLVCGPAWADTIVLLSGCTLRGTISDRDAFATQPRARAEVAILLESNPEAQPELRRVPIAEIDFVVLEANGEKRVFDVRGEHSVIAEPNPAAPNPLQKRYPYTEEPAPMPAKSPRSHRTEAGVGLMFGGASLLLVGALVEFDNGQSVSWAPAYAGSDPIEYDTRNYVLMGVGGVLMLAGLITVAGPREPARPSVGVETVGGEAVLAYHRGF